MDASLTAGGEWSAVHARQEGLQVQAVGACGVVAGMVVGVDVGADHPVTPLAGLLNLPALPDDTATERTDGQREAGAV